MLFLRSCVIFFLFLIVTSGATVKRNRPDTVRQLLSTGVSHLLWKKLGPDIRVSDTCKKSLRQTLIGFRDGSVWAYRLLDASSKTADGLIGGTVTSFADYDGCLQTESPDFQGKYCSFKFTYSANDRSVNRSREIDKFLLTKIPVFDWYFLHQAICLPSTCSEEDAAVIIDYALKDTSFERVLHIHCDTTEGVSLKSKIGNASTSQWISSIFLISVSSLVLLASLQELIKGYQSESFLRHFSAIDSTRKLLEMKESGRLSLIDYFRVTVIFFGIAGHSFGCLETVPGWYTVSSLYVMKERFQWFMVQPLVNEGGLGIGITYMGGFVTFWSMEKFVRSNSLDFKAAIFDRWLRYMPPVMTMVALDIMWPFFGDGPMYTQISRHLLKKCTNNAWMNFLFIGNIKTAPDNCVPHTFYQSIDIQLFIVGLLMVYLLCKKPKVGVIGCLSLILLGNATLLYKTSQFLVSPVLIERNVTVAKTTNYLDIVHFATYGHLSNYFIGLLVAYSLQVDGLLLKWSSLINWAYLPAMLVSGTIHFAPALHNTFRLITPETTPFYIVGVKLLYVFYTTVYIMRYFLLVEKAKYKKESGPPKISGVQSLINLGMKLLEDVVDLIRNFSDEVATSQVMRVIIRLSFAMYICNYAFIRYDYFVNRLHVDIVPNTLHSLMKRLLFTFTIVLFQSYLFHVLFVAPFDNLRRSLNIRVVRRNKIEPKQE